MIKQFSNWFVNLGIRNKLIITFTMVLFLVMIFVYAYFPYQQKKSVYRELDRRITTLANSAALGLGIFISEESYNAWSEVVDWLNKDPAFAYISIYDENHELIASKPENSIHVKPIALAYRKPVKDANMIRIRVPINYKNKYLGDIVLGMDLALVKEAVNRINFISTITLAGIFTAGFLLVFFISGLINKPLRLLLDSVNKIIHSGHYSERVGHTSDDEIGILATQFDEMIDMVEQRDFELNQQFEELQVATNLKDEFLAVTAHDLRSPLTAIFGFTELLLMADYIKESDKKRLRQIQQSSEFLTNMVSDIMDISRLESGKGDFDLAPLPLISVVKSSVGTMQYMALPKEIDLTLSDRSSGRNIILGNFDAMLRVANNLISNAVKFTPKNGKIKVVLEPGTQAQTIHFAVEDNGIGIAEEKLSQLFDTYTRVSQQGTAGERGTGLGLSISKTLVDKHHGSIQVKSCEGRGTRFTVTLPLAHQISTNDGEEAGIDSKTAFKAKFKARIKVKIEEKSKKDVKVVPCQNI